MGNLNGNHNYSTVTKNKIKWLEKELLWLDLNVMTLLCAVKARGVEISLIVSPSPWHYSLLQYINSDDFLTGMHCTH